FYFIIFSNPFSH
ncbi:hypothetical protein EC950183_4999, partial [Escherichia coli 95.0183]